MTLPGLDISYAQATTPPLANQAFVFVRAGYGPANGDARWHQHSAAVRAAGKVLGAYWFWYDGTAGATQAQAFLSIAAGADLLALDYEGAAKDQAGAREFIAYIQGQGREIGLYASQSGFPDFGQDWNWVARWGSIPPSFPWAFWQWQGNPLDLDRFNGDAAALAKLVGSSSGGPIQEDIVPKPIDSTDPAYIGWDAGTPYFELDGTTPMGKTGNAVTATATSGRYSPFKCGTQRAFYVGDVPTSKLALIRPNGSFPIQPTAPLATILSPGLYEVS